MTAQHKARRSIFDRNLTARYIETYAISDCFLRFSSSPNYPKPATKNPQTVVYQWFAGFSYRNIATL